MMRSDNELNLWEHMNWAIAVAVRNDDLPLAKEVVEQLRRLEDCQAELVSAECDCCDLIGLTPGEYRRP
jgi:hypothetical protein